MTKYSALLIVKELITSKQKKIPGGLLGNTSHSARSSQQIAGSWNPHPVCEGHVRKLCNYRCAILRSDSAREIKPYMQWCKVSQRVASYCLM